MATTNLNIMIIAVLATIMAIPVSAQGVTNVIHVGGEKGWRYGYDYQAFIDKHKVYVGDHLHFVYPRGEHNVVEIPYYEEEYYKKCTVPHGVLPRTSGNDKIEMTFPGRKYFICSVKDGNHCRDGKMKFHVDVLNPYTSSADSKARKLVAEKD